MSPTDVTQIRMALQLRLHRRTGDGQQRQGVVDLTFLTESPESEREKPATTTEAASSVVRLEAG